MKQINNWQSQNIRNSDNCYSVNKSFRLKKTVNNIYDLFKNMKTMVIFYVTINFFMCLFFKLLVFIIRQFK